MGSLTPEERPIVGKLVNEAKSEVEAKLRRSWNCKIKGLKKKMLNLQVK